MHGKTTIKKKRSDVVFKRYLAKQTAKYTRQTGTFHPFKSPRSKIKSASSTPRFLWGM
jgi:hypothetical protein